VRSGLIIELCVAKQMRDLFQEIDGLAWWERAARPAPERDYGML